MNRVFSILMIIVVMLPSFTKIGILVDFEINEDYIAKVLCINKEKPLMKCNGNCYLSKQLKKAEEQANKHAPTNKKERAEIIYFHSDCLIDFSNLTDNYVSKLNIAHIDRFYQSSYITETFHPPKFDLI